MKLVSLILGCILFNILLSLPKEHHIKMIKTTFVQQYLTIKAGDTVTWTNTTKKLHNVYSKKFKPLRSKYLRKGQSYSYTFKEKGEFPYYCVPHRTKGMTGTIIVE